MNTVKLFFQDNINTDQFTNSNNKILNKYIGQVKIILNT